jgi:acetylornithine/succinyldiaminopimelate/putrescine aminotransferase
MRAQAERIHFQTNLVGMEVRRLAHDDLASVAPEGLDRVFMVNSGAEANENALRVAFRATGRSRVVALEGGFHGRTAAAGACTHGNQRWYGFPRTPFDVTWVAHDDADALRAAIDDDVAAVILEPVQGIAGARPLSRDMLRAAREETSRRGALLIADEVQCGMGRTGWMFAMDETGVVPDIITTAKGLAGGFPAGAVIARNDLADALGPGVLGTTFGGGPLACALVREVVARLRSPGFLERVSKVATAIATRCVTGPVVAVQGRGLLLGLLCDRPAVDVLSALRERGVLAGGASDPRVIRLMPPLIIGEAEVDVLASALADLGASTPTPHPQSPGGGPASVPLGGDSGGVPSETSS